MSKKLANTLTIVQAIRRTYRDDPEAAGEDELSISIRRLSPPYSDDCNWQVIVFVETKYAEALQRAIDAARAEYTLDGSFPGQSAGPRA